jgi:hypothetical protein
MDMQKIKILTITLILISFINSQTVAAKYKTYQQHVYKPYSAENGSYRGEMSRRTYRPKNEYVRSYKHKDGSRVRSYYRSRKNR